MEPKDINLLLVGAKIAYKSGNLKVGKERIDSLLKIDKKYIEVLDEELKELINN